MWSLRYTWNVLKGQEVICCFWMRLCASVLIHFLLKCPCWRSKVSFKKFCCFVNVKNMLILLSCFRFESLNIHWSLHSKTNWLYSYLGVYTLKIIKEKRHACFLCTVILFFCLYRGFPNKLFIQFVHEVFCIIRGLLQISGCQGEKKLCVET